MKNRLSDLRNHLFSTLEQLTDPDPDKPPMTLETAKVIADVAQTLINSAKVEVDFLRTQQNARPSEFFPQLPTLAGSSPSPPPRSRLIENDP